MNRGLWIAPLLLALVACGGGSDDTSAASTNTPNTTKASESPSEAAPSQIAPEDELEQAYRTYVKAFLTGDGATAYALLSERCRKSEPLSEFASLAESAADIYGEVNYKVNDVSVNGGEGRVDATYAVDALNNGGGSLWVLEDGAWHLDKCG